MSTTINIPQNICRTCLTLLIGPTNSVDLFDDKLDLIRKIMDISNIEIQHSLDLPTQICNSCFESINKCYGFRKVLIDSDYDLRTRLEALKTNFNVTNGEIKAEPNEVDDNEGNNDMNDNLYSLAEDPLLLSPLEIVKEESIILEKKVNQEKLLKKPTKESRSKLTKSNPEKFGTTVNKCITCDQTFEHQYKLLRHRKSAHPIMKLCNICGKVVRDDNYNRHLQTHSVPEEDKSVIKKCSDCNETFENYLKLHSHKKSAHKNMKLCIVCGKFVRVDNYSHHIRAHTDIPRKCDVCDKMFKNSDSLRIHKNDSHKGNVYTCEICGKTFLRRYNHKMHVKIHSGKYPDNVKTKCHICGKKMHVASIKRHMFSHTGESPYACTYCQKQFRSPYALKVHTRLHTNERPYVCNHCGASFPVKVSLMTHINSKKCLEMSKNISEQS